MGSAGLSSVPQSCFSRFPSVFAPLVKNSSMITSRNIVDNTNICKLWLLVYVNFGVFRILDHAQKIRNFFYEPFIPKYLKK